MSKNIAFPFLRLSENSAKASDWQIFRDGIGPLENSGYIPDWDYASRLLVQRTIEIDREKAAEDLKIAEAELKLAVQFRIRTGPGRFPRNVARTSFRLDGSQAQVVIRHDVEGSKLSRRINLVTEVILAERPQKPSALSPVVTGSRLWSDEHDLRLEGQEPRFPIELSSFQDQFRSGSKTQALWYLHWNPSSLSADFHGAVRLYINSDRPEFVQRIHAGERDAMQLLMGGVVSQIAERTIVDPDLDDIIAEGEAGTVAGVLRMWLSTAFPGMAVSQVRDLMEHRPGLFHAGLQGLSDVLGEPP